MAHVVVTIAGRTYRMACEDGEEPRLEALARLVEAKILAMREGFSEIGEQRVVVMTAIALADETSEARGKMHALQADLETARSELTAARQQNAHMSERLAAALDAAAGRIERLTSELQKPLVKRDDMA